MKRLKFKNERWYANASQRQLQLRYNRVVNMYTRAKMGLQIPNARSDLEAIMSICEALGVKCKK